MQLDQYEKLKMRIKEASDIITNLKLENRRLKKENEKLKNESYPISKQGPSDRIEKDEMLDHQNKILQSKQSLISSRLTHILGKIKHLKICILQITNLDKKSTMI